MQGVPNMVRPSRAEQKLIDFSRETFGIPLSELLLCGYGEARPLSSRDFVIELTGNESREKLLRMIFVAEGPASTQPSLPLGKEPLVLLALIWHLINSAKESTYNLTYTCNDLLELLEWEDTSQSRTQIQVSVTKYFHSFYQLSNETSDEATRGRCEYVRKVRSINEHYFAIEDNVPLESLTTDFVVFSLNFIKTLNERKLLGVDWEQVKAFTPQPIEFFNLI
jgi:hypothetical protein